MSRTLPALAAAGLAALRPAAFRLRDERAGDVAAREALLDASFGPARFAKTCERLREGRRPAEGLSLVAVDGGTVVATLRFWHVECGSRPALMLGPLAVAASHRSAGIGGALIAHGLRRAGRLGHGGVMLVGDAPYYARFGFSRAPVERLVLPGPVDLARFLGLELRPGGLAGARGRVVATGLIVGERRSGEPLRRAA
nr:N-acetyltransferase [Lichenibacterium sp. 6Y81]